MKMAEENDDTKKVKNPASHHVFINMRVCGAFAIIVYFN
jgi:hypothetical protein